MQSKSTTSIRGIDVSHYQGAINWENVAAAGIQFAYVKASEGHTITDPMFVTNMNGARANGIKTGAYHFAYPHQDTAVAEAQTFVSQLQNVKCDLIPVLDMEEPTDPSQITVAALVQWVRDFRAYVKQQTGMDVMLYTGNWFIERFNGLGNALTDMKLWVANYGTDTPPDDGGWNHWTEFQYTSSGTVNGISGDVDMDVVTSLADITVGATSTPVTPAPTSPPVVSTASPSLNPSVITVQLNGAPFHTGIAINNVTYVVWTALKTLGVPYTIKNGSGLFDINGVTTQGVVYNGDTYFPWDKLGVTLTPVKINGGWNFIGQYVKPVANDVKPSDWFNDAVTYCVQHGLMSVDSSGNFNPSTPVDRATLAQVFYNLSKVGK